MRVKSEIMRGSEATEPEWAKRASGGREVSHATTWRFFIFECEIVRSGSSGAYFSLESILLSIYLLHSTDIICVITGIIFVIKGEVSPNNVDWVSRKQI